MNRNHEASSSSFQINTYLNPRFKTEAYLPCDWTKGASSLWCVGCLRHCRAPAAESRCQRAGLEPSAERRAPARGTEPFAPLPVYLHVLLSFAAPLVFSSFLPRLQDSLISIALQGGTVGLRARRAGLRCGRGRGVRGGAGQGSCEALAEAAGALAATQRERCQGLRAPVALVSEQPNRDSAIADRNAFSFERSRRRFARPPPELRDPASASTGRPGWRFPPPRHSPL